MNNFCLLPCWIGGWEPQSGSILCAWAQTVCSIFLADLHPHQIAWDLEYFNFCNFWLIALSWSIQIISSSQKQNLLDFAVAATTPSIIHENCKFHPYKGRSQPVTQRKGAAVLLVIFGRSGRIVVKWFEGWIDQYLTFCWLLIWLVVGTFFLHLPLTMSI